MDNPAPRKSLQSLLLTALLITTSLAMAFATPATADSGRSTGNEEIILTVNSDYYDRGSDITLTVTSQNLDPNTEYTLTWELCSNRWGGVHCALYQEYSADSLDDPTETEGTIDLGSGNNFQATTITFSDPGLLIHTPDQTGQTDGTWEGLENESYLFTATLSVQGVPLDDNNSDNFVLGGTVGSNSHLNTNDNILKNTGVQFMGTFEFDWSNNGILDFDINCGLYEDGITTPVDTYEFESVTHWDEHLNFGGGNTTTTVDDLVPTATSGTHHIECSITRLVDNTVMHTIIGNDFEVIDADTTGLEEFLFQNPSSTHFERTMGSTTTQISVSVELTDMFPGEEYTLTWELCSNRWGGTECALYQEYSADSIDDPTETEGEITFTPSTASHTETFTVDDPGLLIHTPDQTGQTDGTWEGLENESYLFTATLSVQGVPLDDNNSDNFVLGGTVGSNSYLNTNDNILKNTDVYFSGRYYFDWENNYILDFDINCGLYEDGITTPVDTYQFSSVSPNDDRYSFGGGGNSSNTFAPTATSGTHHIECSITRLVDNTVMHTIIGNDFEVIDDTSNQDDATITVSHAVDSVEGWATVTIVASDLDAGQAYSLVWEVDDNAQNPTVDLDDGHYEWVEGTDGVDTHVIEFRALDDSTNACFSVTFSAGTDVLQTVAAICWNQLSISDIDQDGVYDKNDECVDTPAGTPGVQANGCSDTDADGWPDSDEIACDLASIGWHLDVNIMPVDTDNDGLCDDLDDDDDNDGFLDLDELVSGTDPLDANSKPANRLPACSVHYTLEADGIPATITGTAAIPALSATGAAAAGSGQSVTIPAGNYYIIAVCEDPDGDDITVTVNDITVGPLSGVVQAGAIIEVGPDVAETVDVTITWTDGTDTATSTVTVNLDGSSSSSSIPGFTAGIGLMGLLSAVFVLSRRKD